jgi:nucleotide-binding universal stress UspA family protein
MSTPHTLVVPLDGSELSEAALPWAVLLARAHTLDLLLVEAVDWPPAALLGGVEGSLAPGVYQEIVDEEEAGASEYLLGIRERLATEGVRVQIAVCDGEPSRNVLDLADERGAFAICMATHARGGVARLLHGSVADRVLHDSTHPVFLVPARASESGRSPSFSRLLVPLDGSPLAERAVNAAREIATPGATISLVRVVGLVDEAVQVEKDGSLHLGTTHHAVELDEDYLDALAVPLRHEGFAVHTSVRTGTDWREIVATARDEDVDVVLMSTYGGTQLARWAVGSVVDQVVRHEDRPIFLVSPKALAASPELNAIPRHSYLSGAPRSAKG